MCNYHTAARQEHKMMPYLIYGLLNSAQHILGSNL
jgi:hypothetical protein